MPEWTLGELGSAATRRVGFRSDIPLSEVSLWINQSQQDFVRDIPELLSEKTHWFSLNSGDSIIDLPTTWVETIAISHQTATAGSGRSVRQMAIETMDAKGYYPIGEPRGYAIYNKQIQFWPSANSSENSVSPTSGRSYLHRYKGYPEDMVSTASTPSVAYEHRKGILYKTEVYLHELLGNLEEAAFAETRYVNYIASLKDSMSRRHAARNRFAVSLPIWRKKNPGIKTHESDEPWLRS